METVLTQQLFDLVKKNLNFINIILERGKDVFKAFHLNMNSKLYSLSNQIYLLRYGIREKKKIIIDIKRFWQKIPDQV